MKAGFAAFVSLMLCACVAMKSAPQSPAPPPVAGAATHVVSAAAPAVPESEMAHWAKSQGYRLTTIGQRSLWCKKEFTVASTIAQRTCLSEADLAMLRRVNERNRETLLNSPHGCLSASCDMLLKPGH